MTAPPPTTRHTVTAAGPWRPTLAHHRAVVVATIVAAVAVLWRRPDLLVIATPFATIAGWAVHTRPTTPPTFTDRLGNSVVREGDATIWRGTLARGATDAADRHREQGTLAVGGTVPRADESDHDGAAGGRARVAGLDLVAVAHPGGDWLECRPRSGAVAVAAEHGAAEVTVTVRATRWGRHATLPAQVAFASSWAAYRHTVRTKPHQLAVLPLPAVFDTDTSFRPSHGLVGVHRSSRPGEGSEFAAIRPFRVGDRLRRIHWPTSLRTGELHVSATWADQDTHVVLIVDATDDIGNSEGVDGAASSLDTTVRAAGAIAQHYSRAGDRVSLRVIGGTTRLDVPPATGRPHLRRILDTLTYVRPSGRGWAARGAVDRRRLAVDGGALAIMLSPMITPDALERAVALGRHGVTVAVVDTLPPEVIVDDDPATTLAWRIRLLERRRELRAVVHAGIPVIPWRGPGSLDQFLRSVAQRAHAPRVRAR